MQIFVNEQTRAAYVEVLSDLWADGREATARGWIEMHSDFDDAVKSLGRQLRKDFRDKYLTDNEGEWCQLTHTLMATGLRRVYWQQIAERVLAPFREEAEKTQDNGPDDDGGAAA